MSEPTCPRCGAESRAPYDPAFSGKVWWCESTDSALGFSQGYACVCRERNKFQAMLDEYPKTKDGVTVHNGMKIWCIHATGKIEDHEVVVAAYTGDYYDPSDVNFDEYYSTREIAEQARKAGARCVKI